PYLARAQNRLAEILEHSGRVAEAEDWLQQGYEDLRRLLKDYPDVLNFRSELVTTATAYARLCAARGKVAEAAEAYRLALDIRNRSGTEPADDGSSLNDLAWLLVTLADATFHDPRRAVALAERAVAQVPRNANYWNTLGVAHYRAGDYPAAWAALEKA